MSIKPDQLLHLIKGRRTVYPYAFSDKEIENSIVDKILEAATWAPNHGCTEPWRFKVFIDKQKEELSHFLTSTYSSIFTGDSYNDKKANNYKTWPQMSAAIVAVVMEKGTNPKIPVFEEERAVAAAIQNMLLLAYSYKIGSYWSTGKLVYSNEMKSFLGINAEDQVIGLVYLGYINSSPKTKKRRSIKDLML